MNPGTLDRTIQIQRELDGLPMVTATGVVMTTADGTIMVTGSNRDARFGEVISNWGLWKTRRANRKALRGSEDTESGREVGRQVVRFRIRYTAGITLMDRIVEDGHAYDIVNIIEVGRRELHDLECVLISNTRPA